MLKKIKYSRPVILCFCRDCSLLPHRKNRSSQFPDLQIEKRLQDAG